MIVSSFYEKAELEQFLKHEIETLDYADCIEACWTALLQARLSVVLKTGENYDPNSIIVTLATTEIDSRQTWPI